MSDPQTSPLDREQFAEQIEAFLRAQSDIEVRERNDLTLELHVGQSDMQLSLVNFYRAYLQQPDALAEVRKILLQAVRNYDEARRISSFESLRERVFPMLKPITLLAQLRERDLPMLVYRPFLADLIITYVIEEPSSLAYISEPHLERWQLGEHELHEHAMRNLRNRTAERGSYTVSGEGAQRIVVLNAQDGYDATRLLMPELLFRLQPQFPGTMVIGVPNRDFLIAFSDADEQILTNVAHQIQIDAGQREYGLTDQLFTLIQGEVREYKWD